MIVERFLQWIRTAGPDRRAEAAHALARAFLYSPLADAERDGLEAALTILLDDPAVGVRLALADALGASDKAPHHVILTLAGDQAHVSALVAERSPVLLDSELVDLIATKGDTVQAAIARRPFVSRAVAAALSEVGSAQACLDLMCNGGARIARFSVDRIVERHGSDPELRDILLKRRDLPLDIRQKLLDQFSDSLRALVCGRNWLSEERADTVMREAREKATIRIAFEAPVGEIPALVRKMLDSDRITPAFLIRTAASGQTALFEAALSALSGVPLARVHALIASGRASSIKALLQKAKLPERTYPAFAAAIEVIRQDQENGAGNDYRRATHIIDAILHAYEKRPGRELDQILALLRRFATDAKRDAARDYALRVAQAA